jgi:cold-inducible RNA-binding protein
MSTKLYVGNLSFDSTEESITAAFSKDEGRVKSVSLITDRTTGQSRGFAFVEMDSKADADAAIAALDGKQLDGRALRVNEAQERAPRTDRDRRSW